MSSPIIQEIKVKSVLSKSNLPVCEYSVNPYVVCTHACRYCYASFMKRFANHPEPWGDFLDVKYWTEIKNPKKYAGKELFIGSVTDPYNPQEETCGRTRALLEQLQGSGAKISIATKSDLILRDLDLIKSFPGARVSWSVNTLDEAFREDMDKAVSIRPVRKPLAHRLTRAFAVRPCRFPPNPQRIPAGNRPILTTNSHAIRHTPGFRTGLFIEGWRRWRYFTKWACARPVSYLPSFPGLGM